MSLIVVAADADLPVDLMGKVSDIEAGAVACGEVESALEACGHPGGPDCVICLDLDWARRMADAVPCLPVVLATRGEPGPELLLAALRAGLADVWPLPLDTVAMQGRLQTVRARTAARARTVEGRLRHHGAALERDMRAGRYVQMRLLPSSPCTIGRYRLRYHNAPSMMMSGDFTDYFPLSERHFLFYLADVSGHGASAAFVTVLLKSFSARLRREYRPEMLSEPGRILEWVNAELLELQIDKHVTMILGVVDLANDEVRLVNGGHYPPALRVTAEGPEILRQKGKPVGLFDSVSYECRSFRTRPGDRLVLFSDGIIDALGAGGLEDKERRLLAAAAAGTDVTDVWAGLAIDGAGGSELDDMSCLVIHRER